MLLFTCFFSILDFLTTKVLGKIEFLVCRNSNFKTIKQENVTKMPPTTVVKLHTEESHDTEERSKTTNKFN